MYDDKVLEATSHAIGISYQPGQYDAVFQQIVDRIEQLLQHHFEALVSLLYRLDVDEGKMRKLLEENKNADTAPIIAHLILQRQLEKLESRKQFPRRDDIAEDERW